MADEGEVYHLVLAVLTISRDPEAQVVAAMAFAAVAAAALGQSAELAELVASSAFPRLAGPAAALPVQMAMLEPMAAGPAVLEVVAAARTAMCDRPCPASPRREVAAVMAATALQFRAMAAAAVPAATARSLLAPAMSEN
jgi:hypothetical protein